MSDLIIFISAVETLGAVGVALTSNHEGKYLGNPEFARFFTGMEAMNGAPSAWSLIIVSFSFARLESHCFRPSRQSSDGNRWMCWKIRLCTLRLVSIIIVQSENRFNGCRHIKGIAEFLYVPCSNCAPVFSESLTLSLVLKQVKEKQALDVQTT